MEEGADLLRLATAVKTEYIASDKAVSTNVLVSIQAPSVEDGKEEESEEERPELCLVAVVDKSGSMTGKKMDYTRQTLSFLIQELGPRDRLAIVTYDTCITVDLPLTKMDQSGKDKAAAKAKCIKAGSLTNLSGGLDTGLRLIPSDVDPKTVCSCLLMTDGLANKGIRTAKGIIAMANETMNRKEIGRSIIHTFGYGSDHDAGMLREIANAAEGMYYFIENADNISDAFAECLGGLTSTVAQQMMLTIEASEGVKIDQVFSQKTVEEEEKGQRYRICIGDLQFEEHRDIPVAVTVDACKQTPKEALPLVKFSISYYHLKREEMASATMEAIVRRKPEAEITPDESKVNATVVKQVDRERGVQKMKEAMQLADKGDVTSAKQMLVEEKQRMTSAWKSDNIDDCLMADCEMMEVCDNLNVAEEAMASSTQYRQRNAVINQAAHVMSHQRAVGESKAYGTKAKCMKKAKWSAWK